MAANQDPDPLEAAVSLVLAARSGMLATVHEGMPHASLVTPGLDRDGQPVLLLSALAAHTRHLRENPACALLVTGEAQSGDAQTSNPQTKPRLSLTGTARAVPAEGLREDYLKRHPYAAQYVDFGDFGFWKITIRTARFIGGFASASNLNTAALQREISARQCR